MKKYQAYKNSGVEWVGEIPEGWKMKRLTYVGDFSKGGGISKADLTETGVPVLLYGDIYTKYDIATKVLVRHTSNEVAENSKAISFGDILFTGSGETIEDIGKCITYLGEDEAYAGGDVLIFRPKSANSLFLSYLLNSAEINAEKSKLAKGQIIIHIYSSQLRNLAVSFPSLTEQTQIAKYLDCKTGKIDTLIDKKKRLIELLKEERTAVINQAVTKGLDPNAPMKDSGIEWLGKIPKHWEITKLKFIGNSIIGVTYSPEDIVDNAKKGTLVLRSSNIQGGKLSLKSTVYIKKTISAKLTLKKGDILICSRNGSKSLIGKNICIDEKCEGKTFGAFMTVFRSKNYEFLSLFFNSEIFKSQSGLFLTATISQLTVDTLNNFYITIPPSKGEQNTIAMYIEEMIQKTDVVISKTQKEITFLQEYKTALISEVVTGKVDVRNEVIN